MVRYLAGLKNVLPNAKQAGLVTDWAMRCLVDIGSIAGHHDELKSNPSLSVQIFEDCASRTT
ncbi:hypothetical protein RAD15_13845 [Bradyrhizobium sp. 14AA]